MTTNFYVTKETTCQKCDGWKFVQDAYWANYWSWEVEFKSKNNRTSTVAEARAWWIESGFEYDQMPDEEIPCPVCGGEGVVGEKVLLVDALRELKTASTGQGQNT